jgi:DNA-binding transcriptional MerR regulator
MFMTGAFTIGRLANEVGCKVQTIRYYEQIGLLPKPVRSEGNQRQYDHSNIGRLRFIRHSRELGFPLDAIRDLLSLSDNPEQTCEAADAIARNQLLRVDQGIRRLQVLKAELERMIVQCRGGKISDCRIIEVLGDHSLCMSDQHSAPN